MSWMVNGSCQLFVRFAYAWHNWAASGILAASYKSQPYVANYDTDTYAMYLIHQTMVMMQSSFNLLSKPPWYTWNHLQNCWFAAFCTAKP